MNKILITLDNQYIKFAICNQVLKEEDLNNTNVINTKNLKFTEKYITENLELVSAFFNLILLKTRITKAKINNLDISLTVLTLVKQLTQIEQVNFIFDEELNYRISFMLLENKKLKK